MERKPLNNFSAESPADDSDDSSSEKSTSKKKALRHLPLAEPAAGKQAESPTEKPKRDLFEFINKSKESAKTPEATETPEASKIEELPLTAEETQHINEEIAAEHLESMQELDEPAAEALEPAAEFLEYVQDGTDVETAFAQVATELGMHEDEIAEALAEVEPAEEPEEFEEVAEAPEAAESTETEPTEPADFEAEVDLNPLTPDVEPVIPRPVPVRPVVPTPAAPTATTTPNTLPPAADTYYDIRRNNPGQLLLVGLVGYLWGRRKGRLKTEHKLLPIQKKLERQVVSLEQNITYKEKQLVAAKARLQERPVRNRQPNPERPAPQEQRRQPGRQETRLGLEKPRAERLGHMVIAAEAPKAKTASEIRKAFRPEEVKTMRRPELLALSEKIIIEGAPLRRIYESNLIGERQLRHLVSEHLQGKDIHRALRKEMVEHEIDFERDPILRDRIRSKITNNDSGSGLNDLLSKVGITDDVPNAELEHRIRKEAAQRQAREHKLQQQRVVSEVALVTAVVVLAVAVVVLALTR